MQDPISPAGPTKGLPQGPARHAAASQHVFSAWSPGKGRGPRPGMPAGDPCPPRPIGDPTALTVFPLPGGRVDDAEELVTGDGLGVQVHGHRLPLQVLIRLVQRLEDLRQGGGRSLRAMSRAHALCQSPRPVEEGGFLCGPRQHPCSGPAPIWPNITLGVAKCCEASCSSGAAAGTPGRGLGHSYSFPDTPCTSCTREKGF